MKFKKKLLLCFAILSVVARAGTVSSLIDYQLYRDFAMNKGKFKVGATNIEVKRADGTSRVISFKMPDFSSTDSSGVGTLYDPSYVGGVSHNRGYQSVTYGYGAGHTYKLVDRNNHGKWDAHAPRLNKLVTDVAPSKMKETISKPGDYEVFVRVGSGGQYIQSPDGERKWVSGAYQFLTGGIIPADQMNNSWVVYDKGNGFNNIVNGESPLPITIEGGDSGSPLWGFNKKTQQWELVAFAVAVTGTSSLYAPITKEFFEDEIAKDTLKEFEATKDGGDIIWGATKIDSEGSNKGVGTISQGKENTLEYNGLAPDLALKDADNEALNHGKHIIFGGDGGTIKLEDNINQGAGKIHFKSDYTVTSENKDKTWVGAGLQIDKDKTVIWQVNGVKDDNLHKIGEGTLHVNGVGVNEGGLNVGDGLVILDQEADNDGKLQAFNNIDIVSGRATVRLTDEKQIDTSKIRFGFRGGRLDLYGNTIDFGDIVATDSGARIVNDNSDKKSIANIDTDKFKGNSSIFHGVFGEFDKDKTNGKLDVNIEGENGKSFAITGGTNLNGDINLNGNTTLILSGGRDLHAGEKIAETQLKGDYYFSEFNFDKLNLGANTDFYGGVYSAINGTVNTSDNNNLTLGYISGESKYIYDKTQETWEQTATEVTMNDENTDGIFNTITTFFKGILNIDNNSSLRAGYTDIEGKIELKNSSTAHLENSILRGDIIGDKSTSVNLENSTWITKGTSNLGDLKLNYGTVVIGKNVEEDMDKVPLNLPEESSQAAVTAEKISGNGSLFFNIDLGSEDNSHLSANSLGGEGLDIDLQVRNVGESNYGKTVKLLSIGGVTEEDLTKIKLSSDGKDYIDIGAIRGELSVGINKDGELVNVVDATLITDNELTKKSASDMSNAGLSNFAAKTSLIKSQKSLIEDALGHMNSENFVPGIMYKGNYSESKFESDKFREYSQTILNHGVGFEDSIKLSDKYTMYRGLAFLYGKSNVDYAGDYSGDMETYSANIYGKILKSTGVYTKGVLGVNYTGTSINEEKVRNYSLTLGTGIGIEKKYRGLEILGETNVNLFYFPQESYQLKDKYGDNYRVSSKESYVMELNPELELKKSFQLNEKSRLSLYTGVGYEYNFYMNKDGADITIDGLAGETGVIENGATFKGGVEAQVQNLTLGVEGKYLTGSDNSEKLTGTLKLEMKF